MKKRYPGRRGWLAFLLAFSLILGLTDVSSLSVRAASMAGSVMNTALTETSAAETAGEDTGDDEGGLTDSGRKETSVGVQPFNLENGAVDLKEEEYERWIDRIDVPEAVLDFYEGLEQGSDNDGTDDFLIDDKLFAQLEKERPAIIVEFDVEEGETLDEKAEVLFDYYTQCLSAAYCAFDRDHPEVFWLGDTWSYTSEIIEESGSYRLEICFVPVRVEKYAGASAIRAAIAQRDTNVKAILDQTAGMSDYEKVQYFNEVLTGKNQYNTVAAGVTADTGDGEDGEEDSGAGEELAIDSDCWECISALAGRIGENGPVCEGYARAFQVLCQEAGIPCTLVDGTAVNTEGSGSHMWNYVRLDDAWYGVDVTWNDPVGGADGAKSGKETDIWLLVGGETLTENVRFLDSHPVSNQPSEDVVAFTNGPELSADRYVPKRQVVLSEVKSYGADGTAQSTFTYGDTITVTAKVSLSGEASEASEDLPEPGLQQVALYYGYTQISEPVNAGDDSVYTMTYHTLDGKVPAGSKNLTVRFIGDGDLSWASRNLNITLNPAVPVLTVPEDQTVIYDPENPVKLPPSSAELLLEDESGNRTLPYSYSYCEKGQTAYTDTVPELPGEYWVKVSVAADPDGFWAAAEKTFSLTIKKLVVGVGFSDSYLPDKVYDGTAPALPTADQMEITLASYDDVVFTWYRGSVAEANKVTEPTQAGDYILVATLADTNTTERAQAEREVTITRRPVTVRITALEKTYGSGDPELAYTVDQATPLVGDETLNGQPVRKAGEDVGIYAVTEGTLTDGNNPNYKISFIGGDFTINPAGYQTDAETVQTILAGNGEFKEPVFTGVRGEKVPGTLTYQYDGVEYTQYVDLIRVLQTKEVGTVGSIQALFVPNADGNYIGSTEVRIAFTISNITFLVGGYQASDANAVTKKEAAVYGDTWDQIVQISDKLSARVGSVTDSDPEHFSLNVTGYPAAGSGIPYEVRYNGVLDGTVYSDVVVCAGTIDVAPAPLTWNTSGLTAQDRETRITNRQATLSGSLQVSGILERDQETVTFSCPAERLAGTYADVTPGNPRVILTWAGDTPVVLQGEGAGNYRLPEELPEITGRITSVRTEPVEGLASDRYQLEIESGLSEVPEALRGDSNLNTTEKIETRMRANIRTKTSAIPDGNMAAYDIRLLVSSDGQNWEEATAENFPAEGILVKLPYPSGTGKDTHDFTVAHMFTAVRGTYQPGDVEYPTVEKTDTGIQFRVYSLSPIEVGWLPVSQTQTPGTTAAPQPTASSPTDSTSGTSSQGGTQVTGSQTGDGNHVVYLYLLFLLAAGTIASLLMEKRRAGRR